ncbi:excinuclease ABC subunit UvrB [Methanospirillum purgamenti]|jgi:excinuclease ABC subunit B|uniref:UvrABC system protein B n=1 Tax=Methanospirillum hungatei TaxID=2203 RepID=A0A8F5ZEJ5_METHU|nr:excinuclease ABC subunit UvrB [Methanospirillum hungatei]NLW75397.1 excinuclease ABC subunit UvrB [Methanomicrobiales archaeon]QXO94842.1 excinuclease ABC subunit UvrB [Methanospirillum hungatei]
MTQFQLVSDFKPTGSQPDAIAELVEGYRTGSSFQTLLGVTGSGKTFTMANVIEQLQIPTLVIAHNKTLAAQLYHEFRDFFPNNRVEYFVSYYDYYQPESYIAKKDQYIEKDAQINPKIEMMRLSATASLLSRNDVIVIASVSCIYGLGKPDTYKRMGFDLGVGQKMSRREIISRLVDNLYERNEIEIIPGRFRVKGDIIDLVPSYYNNIIRIELFGDEVERITEINRTTGNPVERLRHIYVYPASHYVIDEAQKEQALIEIEKELNDRLPHLGMLESHRLRQRTTYDIEMIRETGSCKGIENYSRFFDGRKPGEKPYCLLDYFPERFLMFIDESHQTLPQVRAMFNGDRSRKTPLVEYGFRLPSAFDNRPLRFFEFEQYLKNVICVSATPGDYELDHSNQIVEQIIRPTGLVDPVVEVRPIQGQMENIKFEIQRTIERGDRILITTLTKRLAEELTEYLLSHGVKTRYLHSDIDTLERTEIIRELRLGTFDVLVGINLLREGLDIPEVGFIGILDADKEGFLRDARSLIQIIGRAARNSDAFVVLYADTITGSMQKAMDETERRRALQIEYNTSHGITPKTIQKPVRDQEIDLGKKKKVPKSALPNLIINLESQMKSAAQRLDFEEAIRLRDQLAVLRKEME